MRTRHAPAPWDRLPPPGSNFDRIAPTVVDVFAGAGGLSLGFTDAGFEISWAVEIDRWAAETYALNHPEAKVECADIRLLTDAHIGLAARHADVVVGGPPCQGFSHSNIKRRDPRDPRNSLFKEFCRVVAVVQPKVCLLENVPGLLSVRDASNRRAIDTIVDELATLGYEADFRVLNSAEYGVPQHRQRLFIVGWQRGASDFRWPEPTHRASAAADEPTLFEDLDLPAPLTLWEAIGDLPRITGAPSRPVSYEHPPANRYQALMRVRQCEIRNHEPMRHTPRVASRFEQLKYGESEADLEPLHRPRRRGAVAHEGTAYSQNSRRQRPDRPCATVVASSHTNFVHPFLHRNFTVRELARVQSFPDWFVFSGKRAVLSRKLSERKGLVDDLFLDQRAQVGNAVPPIQAMALANPVRELLEADRRIRTVA